MALYDVTPKPSVEKDLRVLPKSVITRVLERIEALKDNPRPHQSIKVTGREDLYRVRVGDYRIVYEINETAKKVTIHYVRHRREVYRGL